jgi:hypothetical protein
MRSHLGTSFNVWNRRRTWFWSVLDQHGNGGVIGTAATEAEAISDACSSIEERSAPISSHWVTSDRINGNTLMPTSPRACPYNGATFGWTDFWISIARQVTDRMRTGWADRAARSS